MFIACFFILLNKMNINIYYFGGRGDVFQRHRIHHQIRNLQRSLDYNVRQSFSLERLDSSCRKTQPLKLSRRSDRNHEYTNLSNSMQSQISKFYKNYLTPTNKKQQNETTSVSIDNIVKPTIKIMFKRVEQAKKQKKEDCSHPSEKNIKQKSILKIERSSRPSLGFSLKSSKTSQSDLSQPSYLGQLYKVQPLDRLFLCNTCQQFFPLIEIKNHHSSCTPPSTQADLIFQWQRIIDLIKEISIVDSNKNANLPQLAHLMQEYVSRQYFEKGENDILSSNELSRILSYKSITSLKFLNSDDLFQVIQSLGDRIEASAALSVGFSISKLCC